MIFPNDIRGNKDSIFFKTAETYWIAAEALMMPGEATETTSDFSAIFYRASLPRVDYPISGSELNIDMLLDESRRELPG